MHKKKILKLVYTFVIILLVITFFSRSIHHLTLPKVVVDKAKSGSISIDVAFDSSLMPNDSISEYAGLTSVVTNKFYNNGDQVKVGDIIYILDDQAFQQEYERVKYQIEDLKADISVVDIQYNQLVTNTSFKYEEMVVAVENHYIKNKALFDSGNISQDMLDKSYIAYKSAQLNYDELISTQKKLLEDLMYELKEKQLSLDICAEQIDSCVVIADQDGTLRELTYEQGMMVTNNSLLYKMVTSKSGYVITKNIYETQGKHLKVGDEVTIDVYGKDISSIAVINEINRQDNDYEIVVILMDPKLSMDDTVRVGIKKKLEMYETVLPLEAVHSDNSGDFIYMLHEKEGPLGKEYYAVKEDVTIGEKNLRNIGLVTAIPWDTSVIIRSSKPLLGDRIEVYIED